MRKLISADLIDELRRLRFKVRFDKADKSIVIS